MTDIINKLSLWATEIFVACVEEGTISGAARRLKSSNSTVSQQLSNLEANLGVELLDRSTRPVRLTREGELFLRRARNILAEASQARIELAEFDTSSMLRLRIGMIDDFDADVTPAMITQLSAEMENCSFLLESGSSLGLISDLKSQSLDIAVSADIDEDVTDMEIHPLMKEPFILLAPKNVVDQSKNVVKQIKKLPFIRYSSREIMGRQIEAHLARQQIKLSNHFEINNYHAIQSLVADGAGWAITTPLGFLRARRFAKDIDVMPLPFEPMSRSISLLARKDAIGSIPQKIAKMIRPLIEENLINALPEELTSIKKEFTLIS